MLSWVGRLMISRNMDALRDGDFEPLLKMDADDVHFRFPGDSSFAADFKGKQPLREWLERFVSLGLQIEPDEVLLQGFPWRQTICVRGTIHLDTPGDGRVYDNRYVIWGRIAWGKLRAYEVYEDTQRSKAFDEYLEKRDQPAQDQ